MWRQPLVYLPITNRYVLLAVFPADLTPHSVDKIDAKLDQYSESGKLRYMLVFSAQPD